MEGRSTVEDRWLRNSYHRVCYVFVEQAASECHWNWTAMGDDQCPTEGDSRLRGTREPVHQATDVRAQRYCAPVLLTGETRRLRRTNCSGNK